MKKLKIIIPANFSEQATFAYLMVKKIETKIPVDVHFVHVMSVPDTITLNSNGSFDTCGEVDIQYLQQQKVSADQQLANLVSAYGEQVHTHLLAGKITDSILNFSEAQQADLIVMGTKGSWGMKEKLSGSETQAIATRSKIPVLSLMCDRSDLTIKDLLLVHDFNSTHQLEISLLQQLLAAFNSTLHLLQFVGEDVEKVKPELIKKMQHWANQHDISRYECHVINDVNEEQAVVHFNQKFSIDMVVIGIHEHHGLFNKQSAEALINHLYKPLISLRLN